MAFLQASRMVAAAVAGGQPPTAQMAALAAEEAEAAAAHAPQEMDIDGAPLCRSYKANSVDVSFTP